MSKEIKKEVTEETAKQDEMPEKDMTAEVEAESKQENDEKEESVVDGQEEASSADEEASKSAETKEADKAGSEGENEASESKKIFGKKEKKKDKAQERIEELEDKVKRQLAEFENFRNRTEKEKTAMFETGAKSVIEKILPVIDNFERGLSMIPEEEKESPVADGMNKIYKQLITELEALGVKPIEAVGLEFDPNLHNAVMQVESEEYESGVVAQEMQKGYTYRDTVVRHSMVAVVQ